jgi:hypothetical protein
MEKTLTLFDLKQYLQEINQIENSTQRIRQMSVSPSELTLHTIFRYSRALNILKTQAAGNIYQLAN